MTLYALNDFLPTNARLLLFNFLIMSHLHFSAVLLNGITESPTLTVASFFSPDYNLTLIGPLFLQSKLPKLLP